MTMYPGVIADLFDPDRLMELGPGSPNRAAKARLQSLRPDDFGDTIQDPEMAQACIAGLWLLHNYLDESHTISQGIDTPTGGYWHAIMHRREPDPSNSKYWFRQVGEHPIYADLARGAAEAGYSDIGLIWEPFVFVDRCEEYRGTGGKTEELLRRVQRLECTLLFDWCYRQAVGTV